MSTFPITIYPSIPEKIKSRKAMVIILSILFCSNLKSVTAWESFLGHSFYTLRFFFNLIHNLIHKKNR